MTLTRPPRSGAELWLAALWLFVLLAGCSTGSVDRCIGEWNAAPPDGFDAASVSAMWIAHQDPAEWEGGEDVCWATIARSDGSCISASFVLAGDERWVLDEAPDACRDGLSADWRQVTFAGGVIELSG